MKTASSHYDYVDCKDRTEITDTCCSMICANSYQIKELILL